MQVLSVVCLRNRQVLTFLGKKNLSSSRTSLRGNLSNSDNLTNRFSLECQYLPIA